MLLSSNALSKAINGENAISGNNIAGPYGKAELMPPFAIKIDQGSMLEKLAALSKKGKKKSW